MVDLLDQIQKEEEDKVRHNPVFNGIDIREDKFFKFDDMRASELKKALKTDDVQKNKELKDALEKEILGYSKKNMTKEEIMLEQIMFDKMHNLDFMMEDGELMQDDEVVKKIILKEVTKTKDQVIDDHRKLDGNLVLKCDTVNGYMQAVFQLLSHNKTFVRYFMRNAYQNSSMKIKPFCDVLNNVFSQKWRPTDLIADRNFVDITDIKTKFRGQFNHNEPHDAYRFLAHLMNGVTKETVTMPKKSKSSTQKHLDTYNYFQQGITNQCFAMLSGMTFECEGKKHVSEVLSSHSFINIHEAKYMHNELNLEAMIEHLFRRTKGESYCKSCDKDVKGQSQRKILVLPKTILVVLDRFDDNGALKNLLG